MLKQRIATALVLALLFLGSLFLLPPVWFLGLVTLAVVIAGWEWANLAGIVSVIARVGYVTLLLLVIAGLYLWLQSVGRARPASCYTASSWWVPAGGH